jgi:hypothetical protein
VPPVLPFGMNWRYIFLGRVPRKLVCNSSDRTGILRLSRDSYT